MVDGLIRRPEFSFAKDGFLADEDWIGWNAWRALAPGEAA
jgi:hypothetical protein